MISVKNADVLFELLDGVYHHKLAELVVYIVTIMQKMNIPPVITSGFRPNDKGVHGSGRGMDFRTWNMDQDEILTVCEVINKNWKYDYTRPEKVCLIYHDSGKGPHLHAQVHPNTRKV